MADQLRTPFFIAAFVLMVLIVVVEIGGGLLISAPATADVCSQLPDEELRAECDPEEMAGIADAVPGAAIGALALVDGILLFTVGLMLVSLTISNALHGKIQGIITLIFSLFTLLTALGIGFAVFGKLLVMVGLLFSFPFGTIAYFALYASFARGAAAGLLSLIMLLKIAFIVCLLLAQQRFLQNKGLVLMIFTALIANVVISLLHGLVPLFLVSITDAIAAILMAVFAAIWAIVLLVGAIVSVVKVLT